MHFYKTQFFKLHAIQIREITGKLIFYSTNRNSFSSFAFPTLRTFFIRKIAVRRVFHYVRKLSFTTRVKLQTETFLWPNSGKNMQGAKSPVLTLGGEISGFSPRGRNLRPPPRGRNLRGRSLRGRSLRGRSLRGRILLTSIYIYIYIYRLMNWVCFWDITRGIRTFHA
jgi:hypothetical protein